jgi:hypothetical protein
LIGLRFSGYSQSRDNWSQWWSGWSQWCVVWIWRTKCCKKLLHLCPHFPRYGYTGGWGAGNVFWNDGCVGVELNLKGEGCVGVEWDGTW